MDKTNAPLYQKLKYLHQLEQNLKVGTTNLQKSNSLKHAPGKHNLI